MPIDGLRFREGTLSDLEVTFALAERASHQAAAENPIVPFGSPPSEADIKAEWLRQRPLVEFIAAQSDGRYWICEHEGEMVGYARVVRFGAMEELAELEVELGHQGRGIGRALLERCWPGDPTPDLGRIVVASGAPASLSLYTAFGVMPIAGHWCLRQRADAYLHARAAELEDTQAAAVHVLAPDRAVAEWQRLEPPAIGHQRPQLHEFFGRDRTCLGYLDDATGEVTGLCWVSGDAQIGPAVGAWPKDLVPVTLAALDRVAKTQEPEHLTIHVTTIAWWLLRRLRTLGFQVYVPAWIMCSEPIPGLDRYTPTRPPHLL